jgi:hypothetical protein
MPYIIWVSEHGHPRIVALMHTVFAMTSENQRHTYKQFQKIVGKEKAYAALRRYLQNQAAA